MSKPINQTSNKEFLTEKATIVATLLKEGRTEEAKEVFRSCGCILVPIVEQFVDCESASYKLDENTKMNYADRVYNVVERDFFKFNNPEFMKEQDLGKLFEFKTFLKSRTKECVRDAIADTLGISQYKCRLLLRIRVARTQIAMENMVSEDKVTVDEIRERLGDDTKNEKIVELLEIEKGIVSLDEVREKGEQIDFTEGIEASVLGNEIDSDTKAKMDDVFGKLSKLDVLILLKNKKILGEEMYRMEACDFVITPIFKSLFEEDTSIRSKVNPIKTVYAKTQKIEKVLSEMNGKINMADVDGCLVRYFVEKIDLK